MQVWECNITTYFRWWGMRRFWWQRVCDPGESLKSLNVLNAICILVFMLDCKMSNVQRMVELLVFGSLEVVEVVGERGLLTRCQKGMSLWLTSVSMSTRRVATWSSWALKISLLSLRIPLSHLSCCCHQHNAHPCARTHTNRHPICFDYICAHFVHMHVSKYLVLESYGQIDR